MLRSNLLRFPAHDNKSVLPASLPFSGVPVCAACFLPHSNHGLPPNESLVWDVLSEDLIPVHIFLFPQAEDSHMLSSLFPALVK